MDSTSAQGRGDSFAGPGAAETGYDAGARRPSGFEDPVSSERLPPSAKGPAAAERVCEDMRAMRAALELFIAVRRDQLKLALRRTFLWAVAIGLAIFVTAVLAATACVMVMVGMAGGVAELVGGRIWLGQLLTGLVFVGGGGGLAFVLVRIAQQRFRRKTLERYGKIER